MQLAGDDQCEGAADARGQGRIGEKAGPRAGPVRRCHWQTDRGEDERAPGILGEVRGQYVPVPGLC